MDEIANRLRVALSERYTIERRLGEGGMATVYLAEDIKHDRKVALKVLKPELAALLGTERFLQEIKTTASLHHPHILPLFDSGEADGFLYYVMPYVEGETLREKLDRETQLGVDEAVRIATDVAGALEHAHQQGVIHRDVKPSNVLLLGGRPLVADFGIALAVSQAGGTRLTETGLSLGTPHYMSPEQATAEKGLTNRSDVYSLGAVLYEMLTGSPPHTGSTAQQVIARVLAGDAEPVTAIRRSVPPNVADAVTKALEKLPADRFDSAAAFSAALANPAFGIRGGVDARTQRGATPRRWDRTTAALAVITVVAVLMSVWAWFRPRPPVHRPAVTRFTIPVPDGHTMGNGFRTNFDVSPDGRHVAYFAGDQLYVRSFDRVQPERIGVYPGRCCPWFSPDGRWIVFVTTLSAPSIMGVAVEGGPVVDVTAQLRDADLVDGPINGSYLARRRPGGTEWETITRPDTAGNGEGAYMWPQLLPGGTHVLYTVLEPSLMWAGSRIVVEEISSGARTQVAQEGTYGRYAPTGHVVYIDVNGTLHAVAFDLERQAVLGSPFVVDSGVRTAYWGGSASFAVSESGTLAFVRGSSWENHRLTWVDRDGSIIEEVGRPVTVEGVRLSPDGRYAATYVASDNSDIYLFDLQNGDDRRLTFEPETEDNPVWSSDGRSIAYRRIVSGREHRVYTRDLTSGAAPQHVYTADVYVTPRSWSSDGRALALDQEGALLILDLESGRVDTVSTVAATEGGRFSPNGRWLAYVSRETGQHEVYVVSYPELAGKQQVSASGGRMPEWSSQSDELFFLDADTLMVVDVRTNDRFERSAPRPLFVSADLQRGLWFAVSADGERFLYAAANPDAPAREIHVVANWFEELKATEGN